MPPDVVDGFVLTDGMIVGVEIVMVSVKMQLMLA